MYWPKYVPVAERRNRAAKKIAKLKRSGRVVNPVEIAGRSIASTFWGQSWCKNLEAYSDFSNRLPRGRTYVRNGSVVDLQIKAGHVSSLVSGSDFYQVNIKIKPIADKRWQSIKKQCSGQIDSMVELLQGSISKAVMQIVTRHGEGLFPAPGDITLDCTCPDWAVMCKHVAAVLYGVGARLDHEPHMLFTLRGVDADELITAAVIDVPAAKKKGRGRILQTDDMSSMFGIDLDSGAVAGDGEKSPAKSRGRNKAVAKKKVNKKAKKKAAPKKKPASTKTVSKKNPALRKTRVVAKKKVSR